MGQSSNQHILILVEGFYPHLGGGALEQWQLAQKVAEEGMEVTAFTPQIENTPKEETVNGVEIKRPFSGPQDPDKLNSPIAMLRRCLFNLLLLPYLLLYLRNKEVDIIYCPSHLLHPVTIIVGKLYSIPTVQYIGFSPSLRNDAGMDIQHLLEQFMFQFFMGETIFARNPSVVDEVQKYNPTSRIDTVGGIVIENDLRTAVRDSTNKNLRRDLDIPEDATLLCWVGRIVDIKNPEGALELVDQLPERFHLILVGDGPESERVRDLANSDYNTNRIHFIGRLSHERTLQAIGVSDGLVLTSNTEAYPTVVFEALCLDTPVFSTPVGILPRISEENLYLRNLDSLPEVIEENCVSLSRDSAEINQKILNKYGMERFTTTILDRIRELAT